MLIPRVALAALLLTACFREETDCFTIDDADRVVTLEDGDPPRAVTIGIDRELAPRAFDVTPRGDVDATWEISEDLQDGTLTITCAVFPGEGTVTLSPASSRCEVTVDVQCVPSFEETTPPISLPPYATDCQTDEDGCVSTDDTTCHITLDQRLTNDFVRVLVAGTMQNAPGIGVLEVGAFTYVDKLSTAGPGGGVTRSGDTLTRSVYDEYSFSPAATDSVEVASEPVDVSITSTVDQADGTIRLETDIPGVETEPLEATAAAPSEDDQVVITLKQARVCGITVEEE